MLKKLLIIFIIITIIVLISMSQSDIEGIPKGYTKKYEYYDKDGFQDYTDYAKYIYKDNNVIIKNNDYKQIKEGDIENIKEYFEEFYNVMKSQKRLKEYDFDESIISEGDYVRIKTKEGQKIGNSTYKKFDNYSIYFFDKETSTLYYIHNNI